MTSSKNTSREASHESSKARGCAWNAILLIAAVFLLLPIATKFLAFVEERNRSISSGTGGAHPSVDLTQRAVEGYVIRSDRAESVTILPEDLFVAGMLADGSLVLLYPTLASDGSGARTIVAWADGAQREIHRVERHGPLKGWKFSVSVASENGAVAGWASQEATPNQPEGLIRLFTISADGELTLTDSDGLPYDVSDDGKCIVVQDNDFYAVDENGQVIDLALPDRAFQAMPIAISDNGNWIAGIVYFIDDYGNETSRAVRWQGTEYELLPPNDPNPRSSVVIGQTCVSNDGTVIGTSGGLEGSPDRGRLWQVGKEAKDFTGEYSRFAITSADQVLAIAANENGDRILFRDESEWIDLMRYAFESHPPIRLGGFHDVTSTGFVKFSVYSTGTRLERTIVMQMPE